MKEVLFNTIKITVAALLSICIAMHFELAFSVSAGIVTILTIQSTKKETIHTAIERFYAFVIAIFIAYFSFMAVGFNLVGFSIYLFIYIFVCQYFKWFSAMALNSVLISHFLTFESIKMSYLYNEIYLFLIGVSVGIIVNMHLRKKTDYINELKLQADEQIKYILLRMSLRVLEDVKDYDGNCFERLNGLIAQAKTVSLENSKNTLFVKDRTDHEYIHMREHQTQILYEMYKTIRKMHTTPFTAHVISDFLKKIAEEYGVDNDCKTLLEEFYTMDAQMKSVPLPTQRNEFEDRARLFALLRLIEEFLEIKKEYYYKNNNRGAYEYKSDKV